MQPKLSIVLPCLNEAPNLPVIIEKIKDLHLEDKLIEVIIVNNGSSDNSQEVIDKAISGCNCISSVELSENRGYGYGILQGFHVATGDYLGWTHADLQADPVDVINAMQKIAASANPEKTMAKGLRRDRPYVDRFFSKGMGLFESFLLGENLDDINAQPNIIPRTLFEAHSCPPSDFSFDLYYYYSALRSGYEVVRLDVRFPPRVFGTSSWNTGIRGRIRFIVKTLLYSFSLRKYINRAICQSVKDGE